MAAIGELHEYFPTGNIVENLKWAAAEVIAKCKPTPSSSTIDREWRDFVVRMVTITTDKLILHVQTASTQERRETIIRSTRAFITSVDSAICNGTFSNVMNATSHGGGKWQADADKLFKLEDEARHLQTAFDTPPDFGNQSRPAPPVLFTLRNLAGLIDNNIQPGKLGPWIRVQELRKWLNTCDNKHAHHCEMSPRSRSLFTPYPRWLVNVRRQCLVRAKSDQRYVALSYVWGSGAFFQTTKRNIDALQRDGSLGMDNITRLSASHDTEAVFIPKTVQDVIHLTGLLDETYLWVDSLCIVQDDETDKHEQLSCMGSIYANAYVTIVAAGGTAFTGIRGIQGVTEPISSRDYHRPEWWTRADKLSARIQQHRKRLLASKWNQRAWTFQEQIFSRRLLVFDDISATWECHCHVWFEGMDYLDGICEDNHEVVAQGFAFESPAKFKDYVDHVIQYNRRLLTYPEDIMRAFSGILSTLISVFNGGFLCGLPVIFFDLGLLWFNDSPLKKRESVGAHSICDMPPSWSWAAWEGNVLFQEQHDANHSIRSVVKWKYGTIGNTTWKQVLPGATQQPTGSGARESGTVANAVADPSLADAHLPGMLTYYLLSAKAEMVIFTVVEIIDKTGVPLLSKSGECVGMLTSSEAIQSKSCKNIMCEVVAISEMSIGGSEVYNVLWIEWKKGIAYRKGVGRVIKDLWIMEEPETIDLILG